MNRPYVICHMLVTIDGKTEGEFFSLSECRSAAEEYGNIRNYYKPERLRENAAAAEVSLTPDEVKAISALDGMEMSDVFGGSKIAKK